MKTIFAVLFSFISILSIAQKKEKIQILNADDFIYSEKTNRDVQKLVGNVRLKHQDALMFCDSAYVYKLTNQMEAFGNVKIKQGDTLSLTGNYLKYDGNTKIADVRENVVLNRPDISLTTDKLILNRSTNIAFYLNGANINSKTDNNKLYSKKGYYYINKDIFFFKDSVVLTNENYVMKSDTMKYWTTTEEAYFFGPTEIISDDNYIYCENGYYNTVNEKSKFYKNAYLISSKQKLMGDTLTYDRIKGYGEARGHISIIDTSNNITVKGGLAKFYEQSDSAEVTKKALLVQPFEEDTLFMHAQLFRVFPNKEGKRVMQAFYHVNLFKSDLQGSCDSLAYAFTDSTLKMFYQPILWSEQNQITGTIVNISMRNGKIDKLYIPENSFITSEVDSTRYNQIKGKQLTGNFFDNKLKKVFIEGNGQTIYYGQDEQKKFIGVNRAESSDLLIGLKENEIETITFMNDPDATLYPLNELKPDELLLGGFNWKIEFRPLKMTDVFIWNRGELR
jgi:lipopolysaccharide export system protein LptA